MAQYGGYNQQYGSSNNPYDQRAGDSYQQQQQYGNPYNQQGGNPYNQQGSNPYNQQGGNPYDQRGANQNRYGGQQQGGAGQYQDGRNDIEMGNLNSSGGQTQPRRDDPMAILNEVSAIRNGLGQIEQNIERIRQLAQQSRNDPDTSPNTNINRELNSLQADTLAMTKNFTLRVRKLKGKRDYNLPQNRDQVDGVGRAVEKVIQNYQSVTAECDRKMKEQMARQIQIVRPDLSDAEAQRAAEEGQTEQVFASALTNRRGQAASVLRSVEDRRKATEQLQREFEVLAELFTQVNQAIQEQGAVAEKIEEQTAQVRDDQEKAVQEIHQATVHARSRNKYRRWCLLVGILIVLIIVAAVVAWYFGTGQNKKN